MLKIRLRLTTFKSSGLYTLLYRVKTIAYCHDSLWCIARSIKGRKSHFFWIFCYEESHYFWSFCCIVRIMRQLNHTNAPVIRQLMLRSFISLHEYFNNYFHYQRYTGRDHNMNPSRFEFFLLETDKIISILDVIETIFQNKRC